MKLVLAIAAGLAIAACGDPGPAGEPKSINELADQLEPELNRGWEDTKQAIKAEVQQKCGTNVVFPDEPLIIDGEIYAAWIDASATPEQVACVKRLDPDFKTAPK